MTALVPNTRISHGTIECMDHKASRRFYEEVLGLGSVRPLPAAQYLWKGGAWSLVCVGIGVETKPQGVENRFCLRVTAAEEVDRGEIEVLFTAGEEFTNPVGNVQGGFLTAMLDDNLSPG